MGDRLFFAETRSCDEVVVRDCIGVFRKFSFNLCRYDPAVLAYLARTRQERVGYW